MIERKMLSAEGATLNRISNHRVSALRASTSFEVLIHGLTAAVTEYRASGAV